jgi:DNA-binding transcriptional regulator YhcF (GntR family)
LLYLIYNSFFIPGKEEEMYIEIDFNSDEAIYSQLCDQIIMGIAAARLCDGDPLPSVRQLADDIGINMHTVNKAYTVLRQQGYVKVDRRRGAVISVDPGKVNALAELKESLRVDIARASCRNISREDVHKLVDQIFEEYRSDQSGEQGGR